MSKNKPHQKALYFSILELLQRHLSLREIRERLNISKQHLNYYLRQMEKNETIRRRGRGIYEVKGLASNILQPQVKRECRGHAFIWSIKIPERFKINWEERLKRFNINYKLIRGTTPRVIVNNRKIWLGKKTITVYEPHSFYGITSAESKKFAVISLFEVLDTLCLRVQLNLKPYIFKPAKEHYGLIKNDLAVQCNRNKDKIYIRDDLEGEWLWIDDSLSLGELETGGKKALVRNIQVQRWFNDHKKHNFEVTPTLLMENINQVTENQLMFNKNFESHVEAIQTLSKEVKRLGDVVSKLKDSD